MSTDPHDPTPAGPDPDEATEVHQVPADPFAPPAAGGEPTPTPVVPPAEATPEIPAGTAQPGGDWLKPDAVPEPDPLIRTPDAFTPLGTPKDEPSAQAEKVKEGAADVQAKAQDVQAKVLEFYAKPEGKVAAAFLGGILASFVLKRFGR